MASNGKVHQAEAERQQWSEGEAGAGHQSCNFVLKSRTGKDWKPGLVLVAVSKINVWDPFRKQLSSIDLGQARTQ